MSRYVNFTKFSWVKNRYFLLLLSLTLLPLMANCVPTSLETSSEMKTSLDSIAPEIVKLAQKDGIVSSDPVTSTMRLPSMEPYMSSGISERVAKIDAYASEDGTALLEVFTVKNSTPMIAIYFKLDSSNTLGTDYVKFVNFLTSMMTMGGMLNAESARVMVSDALKRTMINAGDLENGPQISTGSFVAQFSSAPPSYYRVYLRPMSDENNVQAGDVLETSSKAQQQEGNASGDDYLPPLR